MCKEQVLKKMEAKKTLMLRIRKKQLKFLGNVMRKEILESLTFT